MVKLLVEINALNFGINDAGYAPFGREMLVVGVLANGKAYSATGCGLYKNIDQPITAFRSSAPVNATHNTLTRFRVGPLGAREPILGVIGFVVEEDNE